MDYSSSDGPVVMGGSYDNRKGSPSRRLLLVVGAVIVVVVAVVVGIILTMSNKENDNAADSVTSISENVGSINIDISGFNPATIKVKAGQQVTWTGNDPRPHRITADQQTLPGFDSTEDLAQGDSYTYVFETPGTYKYYDPADPKTYTGTITVE